MSEEGGGRKRKNSQGQFRGIMMGPGLPPEIAEGLAEAFSAHFNKGIDEDAPVANSVKSLRSMSALMCQKSEIAVGDIARFKVGLNHTRIKGLMIVMAIDQSPVRSSEDPSYAGYCDLQDTKVGVIVNTGHFLEFMVDSRRIEKVSEEELALDMED